MKTKILYIEDEPHLGKIVKETLEFKGFEVAWIADGARVMEVFTRFTPDVCILDIMLPNIDGYTLCSRIRGLFPALPIIFLTAKTETADLLKGFEAGGTDYMRKPFSIEELVARIHNQLKMLNGSTAPPDSLNEGITVGRYRLYPRRYELHSPSGIIRLSQREMQILSILVSSRNRITDRRELLLSVWGDDSFFNSRTLDVYIRKIREYLKEDSSIQLQTLKGKGYLFLLG